jgi:DNA repair protein RadA
VSLEQIPENIKPKLIIIDGVTTLFRAEYVGRETLAEKQGLLRKYLYYIKRYAKEHNVAVVVTNQVYQSPEASPFLSLDLKELAVGGHSLYHAIDNRIFIRKAQHGTRIARLVDSSMYPMQERPFKITEKGVEATTNGDEDSKL